MHKTRIIFSILLVITMLFTLVACNTPKEECTKHLDENNDGKCDLCSTTVEQTEKGETDTEVGGNEQIIDREVTSEIWAQQLTLQGRTNYTSETNSTITNGENEEKQTVTVALDKNVSYMLQSSNDVVSFEIYLDASSAPVKQYSKEQNNSYSVADADSSTLTLLENLASSSQTIIAALGENFSSATFNSNEGKYTCQLDFNGITYSCVVQFSNGSLYSLSFSSNYQVPEVGTLSSVTSFTFDNTTLILPTL